MPEQRGAGIGQCICAITGTGGWSHHTQPIYLQERDQVCIVDYQGPRASKKSESIAPPGFKPPSVIPSSDFSSSVRCKRTTNHFSPSHWELVSIITLLQQFWNVWQGTLPIARGQYLLHCCQCLPSSNHAVTKNPFLTQYSHKARINTNVRKHSPHRQHNPIHTHHITNSYVSTIHKPIIIFTHNNS